LGIQKLHHLLVELSDILVYLVAIEH